MSEGPKTSDAWPAAWWLRSLHRPARATSLGLVGTAALGLSGCAEFPSPQPDPSVAQRQGEFDLHMDALQLQREHGWAVGVPEHGLDPALMRFEGATPLDIDGSTRWRSQLLTLATALQPSQSALMPYYVPTLFQSLAAPADGGLRDLISPIHTAEMDMAFGRGRAILSLFAQVGFPNDTLIIVDLPGPEAVAAAAAMAPRFEPVFAFGNWPHPLGVVPAHETLAAALYYQPLLERARSLRGAGVPAVLVLDANRLAPYGDDGDAFDNRYLANIPSAEGLRALGVKHVLYVTPDGAAPQELDDLNESFVELEQAGIDVRALGMTEIERSADAPPEPQLAEQASPGDSEDEESPVLDEVSEDGWLWASAGLGWFWYFGGHPGWHCNFWNLYPWHHPQHGPSLAMPSHGLGMRMPHSPMWHPSARSTLFSGGQLRAAHVTSAMRPAGFGKMTVHASRQSGHVVGFVGSRSGSFGRVSGWSSG